MRHPRWMCLVMSLLAAGPYTANAQVRVDSGLRGLRSARRPEGTPSLARFGLSRVAPAL